MQQRSSRGVQQHEVDVAADALLAERARPTVERVRAKIGRGSPNTVAPMLEAWFAALPPRLGLAPQEEGNGMPAPVQQAVQVLWDTARGLAETTAVAALTSEREQLDAQRAALATERAELARHAAEAGEREALLRESAGQLRRQVEDMAARLSDAGAALKQRDDALIEARSSIATLVQEKDAAARAHAKGTEGFTKERERLEERSAARERRLLEDVDRARQDAKAAAKALADAENRMAKDRSELERANQALGKSLQGLQLEHVRLQERLTSSGVRPPESDTAALPAKKASARARKRAGSTR